MTFCMTIQKCQKTTGQQSVVLNHKNLKRINHFAADILKKKSTSDGLQFVEGLDYRCSDYQISTIYNSLRCEQLQSRQFNSKMAITNLQLLHFL